ncbi:ABC transporter permease [Muricomes intestini]|jgi:NitT/TauT family transport system permease protein|uniref:ABC transporter permease n=2 Tax=Muricomes intestini TaxID=1796634 RepID=UPI002FD8ED1E
MNQKIKRKKSLWRRMQENRKILAAESTVLPLLLGIVIFICWETQILHGILHTDTFTLPLPSRIANIMGDNVNKIMTNVWATVFVALIGLAAGSLLGYVIAVIAALFPKWGSSGVTIVAAFNAIPIVALAPVMTNWTKGVSEDANTRSMVAKILVVMIVCMANMSINAYRGLTEVQPFSEELMQSLVAGKKEVLVKLRIPNSIPYIFTALKVAVPSSVISALVSEYFAEYIIGVGRQIRENIVLAQYSTAWAYIVAACLIGIIMYAVTMIAENILLKKHA